MNSNLYAKFEECFERHGDSAAFSDTDGRLLATYSDLLEGAARFANALGETGVGPADRVAVLMDKSLGSVLVYLAALKAGAVLLPLNPAYTASEVDHFLADSEPVLLIASEARGAEMGKLVQKYGISLATLEGASRGSFGALAARQSSLNRTAERAQDDLAGLLYTSGTTGRAKGAMITHGNLLSNAQTLHGFWEFVPGDILLHALPAFHVHGLYVALNTAFLNASRIIWHEQFDVREVMRCLPQATVLMGVPTFYTRLLAEKDFDKAQCRTMRLFISGSAPLLPETHKRFLSRTGHSILERYGMTETGMTASNPYRGRRIPGTVGFALPQVEVRICDAGGRIVEPGKPGMIEVRGQNVFKGYWRQPERAPEDFAPDGFFRTGDLGLMDVDGRITIVGRSKDLIITGGLNVYPKEVEQAIDALPGVEESAVVGVPHPDFGEGVVAAVVGNGCGEQAIIDALRENLTAFKIPKRVFLISDLPRNSMGKVLKEELRKRFSTTFGR